MNLFRKTNYLLIGTYLVLSVAAASAQTYSYLIQPGDILEIKVWRHPDLETEVEVDKNGNINLPLVSKVRAAELTSQGLEEELTRLWGADYLKNPYVSVQVQKKKFFVLGEVQEPGSYDLEGKTTILKAISIAGGFTDYAAAGSIYILRGKNSETNKIEVDFKKIQKGESEDIEIQPGDIITVPQSFF